MKAAPLGALVAAAAGVPHKAQQLIKRAKRIATQRAPHVLRGGDKQEDGRHWRALW